MQQYNQQQQQQHSQHSEHSVSYSSMPVILEHPTDQLQPTGELQLQDTEITPESHEGQQEEKEKEKDPTSTSTLGARKVSFASSPSAGQLNSLLNAKKLKHALSSSSNSSQYTSMSSASAGQMSRKFSLGNNGLSQYSSSGVSASTATTHPVAPPPSKPPLPKFNNLVIKTQNIASNTQTTKKNTPTHHTPTSTSTSTSPSRGSTPKSSHRSPLHQSQKSEKSSTSTTTTDKKIHEIQASTSTATSTSETTTDPPEKKTKVKKFSLDDLEQYVPPSTSTKSGHFNHHQTPPQHSSKKVNHLRNTVQSTRSETAGAGQENLKSRRMSVFRPDEYEIEKQQRMQTYLSLQYHQPLRYDGKLKVVHLSAHCPHHRPFGKCDFQLCRLAYEKDQWLQTVRQKVLRAKNLVDEGTLNWIVSIYIFG